jgi:hypothetical protein
MAWFGRNVRSLVLLRCKISIQVMTAMGQTLPSRDFCGTAALPLKSDIGWRGWHVRKVPIPDSCSAASTCAVALFDHLIGSRKQRRGGLETERLGRNQVNYEIEFGRLLDRDVAWFRPPQDFVDIASGTTE